MSSPRDITGQLSIRPPRSRPAPAGKRFGGERGLSLDVFATLTFVLFALALASELACMLVFL